MSSDNTVRGISLRIRYDYARRTITAAASVAEAIKTINQQGTNFGFKLEQSPQFTGRSVAGGSDAVRVFAIDPAVVAAELERSLSKFDARWINSMTWQKVDQPTAAQPQAAPIGHPGPVVTLIDEHLLSFGEIWAAAGHPNTVFKLTPDDLVAMTQGRVAAVA